MLNYYRKTIIVRLLFKFARSTVVGTDIDLLKYTNSGQGIRSEIESSIDEAVFSNIP